MIDLNTHINNYGKPNAIIDFNGNNGILAGIWGFDQIIECINGKTSINGELIQILVHSSKQAGQYTIQWNALNFPSGLYFVMLSVGKQVISQKITLELCQA